MIFPSSLSMVSLYVTLHKPQDTVIGGRWKMSRFKFFWIAFAVLFVYTWIPEYIAPSLQLVSVFCLVGGGNKIMSFLGSGSTNGGVGLFSLTFDWYYVGSAFITVRFHSYVSNSLLSRLPSNTP
jgi:hypothetical protein